MFLPKAGWISSKSEHICFKNIAQTLKGRNKPLSWFWETWFCYLENRKTGRIYELPRFVTAADTLHRYGLGHVTNHQNKHSGSNESFPVPGQFFGRITHNWKFNGLCSILLEMRRICLNGYRMLTCNSAKPTVSHTGVCFWSLFSSVSACVISGKHQRLVGK